MKIIKFYSEACGPCKVLAKQIEVNGLANSITSVNVDFNRKEIEKYNIRSIPTTIVLDETGKEVKRWNGLFDVRELKDYLE